MNVRCETACYEACVATEETLGMVKLAPEPCFEQRVAPAWA